MKISLIRAALGGAGFLAAIAACSSEPPAGDRPTTEVARTDEALRAEAPARAVAAAPVRAVVGAPGVALPRNVMPIAPQQPKPDLQVTASLGYLGGPVLQNVKVVSVNWTTNVDPAVKAQIPQFYTDILNSPYIDWLSEYNTVGRSSANGTTNQGISRGSFLGAFTITPQKCATSAACTVDDVDIKAELARQITAGNLPTPTLGCDGTYVDTIYMFEFPANVTLTATIGTGGTITSCTGFCAYHYNTVINGKIVPYGVHPHMETGPCASNCTLSPPANFADVTSTHSHELIEAITDPAVTIPTNTYAYPSAWGDLTNGEIGDICAYTTGYQQPITVNGRTWTVQTEWSNLSNACIATRTPPVACTGPNTPPGCRACTCADNGEPAGCGSGTCASGVCCTASTCATLGDNCGAPSNGCGGTLSCGTCTAPQTCGGGGAPFHCGCTPTTCAVLGDNCGAPPDGCGNPLSCGTCTAPQTCGGGGTPFHCGCTPTSCAALGDDCGTPSDGCGGMLNCGTCTAPQTCGGGGPANKCGCTPKTCAGLGLDCGSVADGCGGTLSCGTCTAPKTCAGGGTANKCGCTAKTCKGLGLDCGSAADGCGGTLDCGSCAAPQTCGGGGSANKCGCAPTTCAALGDTCGTVGDSCGGTLDCGTCPANQTCSANKCVASATADSGSGADSGPGGPGSSGGDGSANADGGGGGSGDNGGCSCRTVAAPAGGSPAALGFGALLALGAARLRRRRR